MNKVKKIAALALSAVMLGGTAFGLAGCIKGTSTKFSQRALTLNLDNEGRLYWRNGVELTMNVGYDTSTDTAISFTASNNLTRTTDASVVLPDGKTYRQGDLKPAWAALADRLGVTLVDKYQPLKSDASITQLITDENDPLLYTDQNGNLVSDEKQCLWDFDIITGSCAAIQSVQSTNKQAKFLDLSLYLDYMPNYKAFLEENPIIYLSLTTDTETGAMYYAPYFDGNDDIEKYTIIQRSWARKLLDTVDTSRSTLSFKEQAAGKNNPNVGEDDPVITKSTQDGDNVVIDGTRSYITSFMGSTGSWQIDVISPTSVSYSTDAQGRRTSDLSRVTSNSTVKVTVNYDKALAAAKNENTELGGAISRAAGRAYNGQSGNIVDLQNFVINETKGEVTGGQLLDILRAYIDTTYLTRSGEPFYNAGNGGLSRSDIFCSASAAWDVDLLAAMSRCVVTCRRILGSSISSLQALDGSDLFALGGRSSNMQRICDMYSLAGELYGVRGLESRYEFTYIDENGTVRDARESEAAWEAMNRLSAFAKEGLLYTGDVTGTDRSVSSNSTNAPVYFLEHDYVQTQTLYQIRLDVEDTGSFSIPEDYDFAPILTAVSRWNDGTDKIMRFTESWRSVKNTGFCVPYQSVSGDPERLSAVLAFIDFFFSKDGQILMSYGPQSTNGNSNPNGWWYATEIKGSEADLTDTRKFRKIADATNYLEAQYESLDGKTFVYNGRVYEGLDYSGRSIPIMTDDSLNCFKGLTYGDDVRQRTYYLNYTNYARKVIGSALPIGNKDQGFEYQCTASCGLDGASIVDAAINKAGIIKHVYQQIENPERSLWYVIVPTLLPLTKSASDALESKKQKDLDKLFSNSSSVARNSLARVMYNGYGNGTFDGTADMPASSKAIVNKMKDMGMSSRTKYADDAWRRLHSYYEKSIKEKI